MKLSLWIIADWLKKYHPRLNIYQGRMEIEHVKFYMPDRPAESNTLYIARSSSFFSDTNSGILCIHKNDMIVLDTDELEQVFNDTLDAFHYYRCWNDAMNQALIEQKSIEYLLHRSEAILQEPIFILDINHRPIAQSSLYGSDDVDQEWKYMKESGYARLSDVVTMNRKFNDIYSRRDLYHFTESIFPNSVYQRNFFLGDQWVALCNMIEFHGPAPQSLLDLFEVFCNYIQQWFDLNSEQQLHQMLDTMLRETFLGIEEHTADIRMQFQTMGWTDDSQKQFLLLIGINNAFRLHSHLSARLNKAFSQLYACTFNDSICVICEHISDTGNLIDDIRRMAHMGGYYVCTSHTFKDFQELQDCFLQATTVNECCGRESGQIYSFDDYALQYGFQVMKQTVSIDLTHPVVRQLHQYDQRHHTEFSETLYAWLTCERSMVRTAARLQIHKSTLVYRLKRIQELADIDMENPDTRLHLIMSYRFLSEK